MVKSTVRTGKLATKHKESSGMFGNDITRLKTAPTKQTRIGKLSKLLPKKRVLGVQDMNRVLGGIIETSMGTDPFFQNGATLIDLTFIDFP